MTFIRDLIKQAIGDHVRLLDDLEGRLDTAREFYRDQTDEIEPLRSKVRALEGEA